MKQPPQPQANSAHSPSSPSREVGGTQTGASTTPAFGTQLAHPSTLTPNHVMALQRAIGNRATAAYLASHHSPSRPAGSNAQPAPLLPPSAPVHATKAAGIQRQPQKDTRHGTDFYQDDKKPALKLRQIDQAFDGSTRTFRIHNQLQTLYWTKSQEDKYFTDTAFTQEFDLTAFLEVPTMFGSWFESYKETEKEHEHIDTDMTITTLEEKQRRKNAISMYLLQQFITNALFRAKEIDRLDIQVSPLNYQVDSAYLRSFASSYVKVLQDTLPSKYPAGRFILTRAPDFNLVLDKFFEVLRVKDESEITAEKIKLDLATTVTRAAEYLFNSDKDLTHYWEEPDNPQAFVDVSAPLQTKATQPEHVALLARLSALVKDGFIKTLAEALVTKESEDIKYTDKGPLKDTLKTGLEKHIRHEDYKGRLEHIKKHNADALLTQASVYSQSDLKAFAVWLATPKPPSKTVPKLKGDKKTFVDATNTLNSTPNDVGAQTDQSKSFKKLIKTDFKTYLEAKRDENVVKDTDFSGITGGWDAFNKLKDKISRALSSANMVVATGGVLAVRGKGDTYDTHGILLDNPALDMGVKASVNKSGNVPTPTEAGRKLLQHETLKDITKNVILKQKEGKSKGDTTTKDNLEKVRLKLESFNPKTYTSLIDVKSQLVQTQEAFKIFEQKYSKDVDYVKIEAEAAINLLKGSGALDITSPLPGFVLSQLEQHLRDAIATQGKIEDFVRHIQGIHEGVILALELSGTPPDPTYAYGAPQFMESTTDTVDPYFRGTQLADYGLKAFAQAYDAISAQVAENGRDTLNMEAFYNIYFELTGKLRSTKSSSKGKVTMQTPTDVDSYLNSERFKKLDIEVVQPDVIIVDIHPNDATKSKIVSNDVVRLINEIFTKAQSRLEYKDKFRLTVMVDITLNHTTEDEVKAIREGAQPYIKSGNLNLVFVQSLAKFSQLGMDKVNGGLIFSYNDPDKWGKFNESLQKAKAKDPVDPGVQLYFQALFKHASKEQVEYLKAVRKNSTLMHKLLDETFAKLDIKENAITITENVDAGTCYVALRYDEFVSKLFPVTSKATWDDMHHFNVDVLENGINKLLDQLKLPVAMRVSFGFPVSNLGETGKEVRFTIGLEKQEELQQYVNVLAYVNGTLAKKYEGLESSGKFDPLKIQGEREKFLTEMTKDVNTLEELRLKLGALQKKTK